MNIYVPTEEECLALRNPNYVAPSYEEMQKGAELANFVFKGDKNGNYQNPTNYTHNTEQREKISKNHTRHWKGKKVPWKGCTRPDNRDRMHLLWEARRGNPAWNSGLKLDPLSEEHKAKISEATKGKSKPIITCPHCGKKGGKPAMSRFHFDNCKELRNACGDFK